MKLATAGVALHTRVYRLTGGRVGGKIKGSPLLLLHSLGRRSGKRRISPLGFLEDGGRYVVVASNAGSTSHPAWYHNVVAKPDTEIQIGRDRIAVRARVVNPDERTELWARMRDGYSQYEDRAAGRTFPLVSLDPR